MHHYCCEKSTIVNVLPFIKKIYILFIFRERGREGERERNVSAWLCLNCPSPETWPTTQAGTLTGNRPSNPFICRPALNPLNYTSQSKVFPFRSSTQTHTPIHPSPLLVSDAPFLKVGWVPTQERERRFHPPLLTLLHSLWWKIRA